MIAADHLMPVALQVLQKRLKFDVASAGRIGRFDTFTIDLADWNLSLTHANPCIWVQEADLQTMEPAKLADSLRDVTREQSWQNETILVFLDGDIGSLDLHLSPALPLFVLIDHQNQMRIQQANSPSAATLNILLSKMPRSQLAPYETAKPVVGSQFFGRQLEINKVLQHPNTNYLFIGIRRVGKTSLLKEIQRRMDRIDQPQDGQVRRLYVDCTVINSEEDFLRTLTYKLDPVEIKLLLRRAAESKRYERMMFDRFASIHGKPITIIIDELDRLLTQIGNNSPLFDVLRSASTAGLARFIMAGFRQAMNAASDQRSPFHNFASTTRLSRMKLTDVRRMVLGPMDHLRVTIEDREGVVSRINRETAGLPNYIQYYCKTLLEQLDEDGRDTLNENDLRTVYENREFRDFVLETFMTNTEPRERALVYALIAESPSVANRRYFSQREMDEILKQRKVNFRYAVLDEVCRNLGIAGVFNQVGRDYEFAVPLLQRILYETRDVDFLFDKTMEELEYDLIA